MLHTVTIQIWRFHDFIRKWLWLSGANEKLQCPALNTTDWRNLTYWQYYFLHFDSGRVPIHFGRIWWTHTHIATEKSKNFQRKHVQPSSEITPADLGICLVANSSTKRCLERLGISNWPKMVRDLCWYPNQPLYTVNLFPFPKTWPASHLFQDENRPFFGICAQLMLHEKVGPPEATRWNKLPVLIVIRWLD